ncbi:MAG: class I SAM-dependent methyltransferase [Sulfuritalea sp.]|nr:class I SAM-dependent methyltransferase [Sulfuritalea sp.]
MTAAGGGICPVCGGTGIDLGSRRDDRYGYPGDFTLFACRDCAHKFLAAEFTPAQIENLYTGYYPRKDVEPAACKRPADKAVLWSWLDGDRRSAFRWVEPGARVLDIGCGSCGSLLYLRSMGCEVQGVEADRNVLPIAEHLGLKVICGAFDPTNYPAAYFDYVTMDQAIEHFPDPLRILAQVRQILRPGGRLIFSTPNGCGWGQRLFGIRWINWHAPYHLHYFARGSIELAAGRTGFRVLKLASITSSDWLLMQWEHLLSYPAPGCPSDYWIYLRRPGLRAILAKLAVGATHRLKMNHVITRLMDLMGVGDNHLVILQKPREAAALPTQ